METTNSPSLSDSFKSKKILHSSSPAKPSATDQKTNSGSDRSPWISRTPVKPADPPRRGRRCLMSVKELREAATKLRSSDRGRKDQDDQESLQIKSDDSPARKQKKKGDESIDLPEKYVLLPKFFDSLDHSIRLLRLKGYMPTLRKITPQIERLTDRRFSVAHLAQLKFVLPEVIELKKVLVYDEETFCMKPDLQVTMNVDAIKNDREKKTVTGKSDMKSIFRARLLDFVKAHPEDEVPEALLPEPFNRSKISPCISSKMASSSTFLNDALTGASLQHPTAAASHLPQTFRSRFAQQASSQPIIASCTKSITNAKNSFDGDSRANVLLSNLPETPMKQIESWKDEAEGTSTIKGTPAKFISTPGKLMSATPALPPPKRSYMTPDEESTSSPNKLVQRPLRSRSLKFDTPVKNGKVGDEVNSPGESSFDAEIFEILPKNLVQSIREKEMRNQEENDPLISQAKRRKQMIATLPKLFDKIRYFFQSSKRSFVTKEEFLHTLVTTHLDLVGKEEVEEQVVLLKELVPELICEKSASSGDILIGINRLSSPESIRAKLAEAK